jgi:hypothetical protein
MMPSKKARRRLITLTETATTIEDQKQEDSEEEDLLENRGMTIDPFEMSMEIVMRTAEDLSLVHLKVTSEIEIPSLIDMRGMKEAGSETTTILLLDSEESEELMVSDLTEDHILHKTMIHTLVNRLETSMGTVILNMTTETNNETDQGSTEGMITTLHQETSTTSFQEDLEVDLKESLGEEEATEDREHLEELSPLEDKEVTVEDLEEEDLVQDSTGMKDHPEGNTRASMIGQSLLIVLYGNQSSGVTYSTATFNQSLVFLFRIAITKQRINDENCCHSACLQEYLCFLCHGDHISCESSVSTFVVSMLSSSLFVLRSMSSHF